MNKLGMNLFAWTVTMDEELIGTFRFLKQTGFDFIEVPINVPDYTDPASLTKWATLGEQIRGTGLGVQACSICSPDYSLISADETVRRTGIAYLKHIVDCTAALGAKILMGPLYAGFCAFTGKPATAEEWNWSVTGMREVAEHAQTKGVTLAIEYLNRFEIYLLTCTDDLIRYLDAVNHPHCRAAFDTFHANIEEKNMADAIRRVAPYLVHVQISENDRSTPGQGHIDLDSVLTTLDEVGYDGPMAIEAFGVNPPEMATAAHIYRPMFDSPEQLATDGLAYLKGRKEENRKELKIHALPASLSFFLPFLLFSLSLC